MAPGDLEDGIWWRAVGRRRDVGGWYEADPEGAAYAEEEEGEEEEAEAPCWQAAAAEPWMW
jgi:hypothetical protein